MDNELERKGRPSMLEDGLTFERPAGPMDWRSEWGDASEAVDEFVGELVKASGDM